jgi:hypothetical protein
MSSKHSDYLITYALLPSDAHLQPRSFFPRSTALAVTRTLNQSIVALDNVSSPGLFRYLKNAAALKLATGPYKVSTCIGYGSLCSEVTLLPPTAAA